MKVQIVLLLALIVSCAGQQRGGIKGKEAPSWKVTKWHNLPKDKKSLDIGDYKGKVLYLYCFQSWCPGCHSAGFPTLKAVQKMYKNNKNVKFAVLQTVFEGFRTNTFDNGKKVMKKFGLDIPMGQSGENGKKSPFMSAYRTRGTPWVIIISAEGKVLYNNFHIKAADAKKIIDAEFVKKK